MGRGVASGLVARDRPASRLRAGLAPTAGFSAPPAGRSAPVARPMTGTACRSSADRPGDRSPAPSRKCLPAVRRCEPAAIRLALRPHRAHPAPVTTFREQRPGRRGRPEIEASSSPMDQSVTPAGAPAIDPARPRRRRRPARPDQPTGHGNWVKRLTASARYRSAS